MKVLNHAVKFFLIYFSLITSSLSVSRSEFINSISSEASEILSSKLSEREKVSKLKLIAQESVDIDGVGFCNLTSGDIVRHKLVKDIIQAYDNKKN